MNLPFKKLHGAGNDFVVLDARAQKLPDDLGKLARELCHRPFGIGADQLLVVKSGQRAPYFMDIYNADGSRVEMCGNGVRSFVHFLKLEGESLQGVVAVETPCGVVYPEILSDHPEYSSNEIWVKVNMGQPVLELKEIPVHGLKDNLAQVIQLEGEARFPRDPKSVAVNVVSMGNPHAVIFVEDVANYPVQRVGMQVECHEAFPNRTNVEFVEVESRTHLLQRTWERGSGETYACGSGACATVVAGVLSGRCERRVTVTLKGGDLEILWDEGTNQVYQTGPSELVFSGVLDIAT